MLLHSIGSKALTWVALDLKFLHGMNTLAHFVGFRCWRNTGWYDKTPCVKWYGTIRKNVLDFGADLEKRFWTNQLKLKNMCRVLNLKILMKWDVHWILLVSSLYYERITIVTTVACIHVVNNSSMSVIDNLLRHLWSSFAIVTPLKYKPLVDSLLTSCIKVDFEVV